MELKTHKGLAFNTQALIWDDLQNPAKPSTTKITLVPYADARIPQVCLLMEGFSAEQAAARKARELVRPHLKIARVKAPPVIDGVPDDATFKNKTPLKLQIWSSISATATKAARVSKMMAIGDWQGAMGQRQRGR